MSMPVRALRWCSAGERHFGALVDALDDADLDAPSLLPGWTRRTVLAHAARNADALRNLVVWARTGVETPMYPSAEARTAGIEQTARQPSAQLRADYRSAAERLLTALAEMPIEAWDRTVRTSRGLAVDAGEVPWMRARETWVHGVDLGAGSSFDDAPDEVVCALIDDVFAGWTAAGTAPRLVVVAEDAGVRWGSCASNEVVADAPPVVTATGSVGALAGWLTGRCRAERVAFDGPEPELPPWL